MRFIHSSEAGETSTRSPRFRMHAVAVEKLKFGRRWRDELLA